ncbi:MAG: SGNH/GDSL hydrolase family protein, partial [Planctomycetaceae bacterium]
MAPLWSYLSTGYLLAMSVWLLTGIAIFFLLLKRRQHRRSAGKSLTAIHVALGIWFCLAALTIPELYCALFSDHTDSFSMTNISRRWFNRHVRLNAQGFRDEIPFDTLPADGRQRLVFIGDSFTFGHGIDELRLRFSDRVAQQLEVAHPEKWQVNNAGTPGWELRQIVETVDGWTKEGAQIDVLVYAFVLNDIEYFDERTGAYYQQLATLEPRFWFFRETYFYNQFYYRVQAMSRSESVGYYTYLQQSYAGPPWDRFTAKLDELQGICRRNQIDLRIVSFPFLHTSEGEDPFAQALNQL